MSGISATADLLNYGDAGRIAFGAASLAATQATLQEQTTTGVQATRIADMGVSTVPILDLQTQIGQLGALTGNATTASGRLTATATALGTLTSMTQSIATGLLGISGTSSDATGAQVSALAAQAGADLAELGAVLNTKVGDTYVFSGASGGTPTIGNVEALTAGPLADGVATRLSQLGSSPANSVLQSIVTEAASTTPGATPFDPSLASPSTGSVMLGPGQAVTTGVSVTGMGTASGLSTGSSLRDLVAVLTTVSQLGTVDPTQGAFADLVSGLRSMTSGVEAGLTALTGQTGVAQQTVTAASSAASSLSTLLSERVGDLTSADLADVSVQLNDTSNQLEASYTLIKDTASLTLANYL